MHEQRTTWRRSRSGVHDVSVHPSGTPPFLGDSNYVQGRIELMCGRLRHAVYPRRMQIHAIEIAGPVERISFDEATSLDYRPAKLGEQLGPTFATHWFRLEIRVPNEWRGQRVELAWSSNSEAQLWIEGSAIQGFNPGRETARLIQQAQGGEVLQVYVEVACNHLLGADGIPGLPWPEPTHRASHWLQACEIRCFQPDAWELYHDFRVLAELAIDRMPSQESRAIGSGSNPLVRPSLDPTWSGKLLYDLNAVCNTLDPDDRTTWRQAREVLGELLAVTNGSVCHELSAIGHAHIDTAWLWPLAETYRKTVRTFSTALGNMDEYSEYLFACSQAYQYECIERQNPQLFARIQEKVLAGQWIPVGGSYIEPDCNLPWGESLCRQFLIGQQYFESRFGQRCTEFWNPDVFGYAAQLPQILQLAGIENFLTQKLSWNRFTSPPHHTFYWESPDGSRVLTHFPPADTYNGTCEVEELRYHAANYKNSDRGRDAYYLFGHGDGGGGPTREMLETLRRTSDLQGVPRCQHRTPTKFFDRLRRNTRSIPSIVGELYLEAHRGTYTSQAMMKRGLRMCERLLHDIELIGVLAAHASEAIYPQETVRNLWKKLLLNQFHDILPGSSIAEVHEQSRGDFASILEYGQAIRDELLESFAASEQSDSPPLPLNTTSFPRREVVERADEGLVLVEAPAVGVGRCLDASSVGGPVSVDLHDGLLRLQNEFISAVLSEEGEIVELVDRASGRQFLESPGNVVVLHEDRPSVWDAWDVEPSILETARGCEAATRCHVRSTGPLRAEIVFDRAIGEASRLSQVVRLDAESQRLEFHCDVDWQEQHKLLRVLFPTNVQSDHATFEMPFGFTERPTHCNTMADAAKFEVPGHRWADLSEPGYGLALLTDCKYGFSATRGVLGLSLLRAPTYPDRHCDIGKHQFSYAVVPHQEDWRRGDVVKQATHFNQPLLWAKRPASESNQSVFSVQGGLVLDTVKPAEKGDGMILRLYDPYGQRGTSVVETTLPISSVFRSNIMEDELEPMSVVASDARGGAKTSCVTIEHRAAEVVCLYVV